MNFLEKILKFTKNAELENSMCELFNERDYEKKQLEELKTSTLEEKKCDYV